MTEERLKEQNALMLAVLKRIAHELEMFWRASIMARGGRVDNSRWNGLQNELNKVYWIISKVECEQKEEN